jgi:plastocyanin
MTRRTRHRERLGRSLARVMAVVFASLALGMQAATASDAAAPQIHIQNFRFDPPTLEVAAGATVTWVNQDEEVHTVTSSRGLFTSPGLDGDQRFSYRFEGPGTYEYHCALHPQMKGTVVVR